MKIENLLFKRGATFSLSIEALDFSENMLFILEGPNGSGKSTLLHLLLGFIKPKSGRIRYEGEERYGLRFALSTPYYPETWSYQDACQIERHYSEVDALASIRTRLEEQFQLSTYAAKPFRDLSAGMLQKANLCLSLFGTPSYLLLDEPEAHLDADATEALMKAYEDILRSNVRIICATHTTHIWKNLADIYQGQFIRFPITSQ